MLEVITDPPIIKQILLSCFHELGDLDLEFGRDLSLGYIFENLKCIGAYQKICANFTHEYLKFALAEYRMHPKVIVTSQNTKCIKAKLNPKFNPYQFKENFTIGTLSIENTKSGSDNSLERNILENSLTQINLEKGPEFYHFLLRFLELIEYYPY